MASFILKKYDYFTFGEKYYRGKQKKKEGKVVIFGKYINRYYLKNAPALLLGLLSLLIVDIAQLMIPELYRLVINGVNLGKVVVDGQTLTFTREVLFQNICLPMIWIVLMMVIGRFLWRVCFFGPQCVLQADLRERMFDTAVVCRSSIIRSTR